MANKVIPPMVPFVAGYLMACLAREQVQGSMKVKDATPDGADGFIVEFASGLRLSVRVAEVEKERR